MERPESPESSQWVTVCLGLLAPPAAWEPNLNAARARIAARSDAVSFIEPTLFPAQPVIARLAAIVRETNSNSRATWKAAGECGAFRRSNFGFFSRFRSAEETMGGSTLPAASAKTAAGP